MELITGGSSDEPETNRAAKTAEILVVCDEATLRTGQVTDDSICETENGSEVTAETLNRLACSAIFRKVTLDSSGVPINVGRSYRTATNAQWAAAKATHSTCGWHNCDTRIGWCQLHHVIPWESGGLTNQNNLIPLCSSHHHKVHDDKWVIKKLGDGKVQILRPDGSIYRTDAPASRLPP